MPSPSSSSSSAPTTSLGRYRILAPRAGIRVSPLQLGGMSLGSAWEDRMGAMDQASAFALLDAYAAAGGNFLDSANFYQDEQSEQWIGAWMAQRGNRDQMVVATKYSVDHRGYTIGPGAAVNHGGNSRRSLRMSVRDSLAKLQTSWIDILYVHLWDYSTSVREMMDGLHALVEQGTVLYLGASNMPAWVVAAANTYADAYGKTPFVIYQGQWNALCRDMERDMVPLARSFGMALAPFDVLGSGMFQAAAQVQERQETQEALRPWSGTAQTNVQRAMSAALSDIARDLSASLNHEVAPTAVAIAYVLAKAPYVFPVIGGRKIAHLHQNLTALDLRLTPAHIRRLEAVKPFDFGTPYDRIGRDPHDGNEPAPLLTRAGELDFVQAPRPIGYENKEGQ